MPRVVTAEQLADVRANIGKIGYPGACPICLGPSGPDHAQHNGAQYHNDTIICILCGEEAKPARHNHVVCIDCGG